METIREGTCLFCLKEAQESWSNHGRSFDGYYCNCEGQKNYISAKKRASILIDNALKQVKDNDKRMTTKHGYIIKIGHPTEREVTIIKKDYGGTFSLDSILVLDKSDLRYILDELR